MSEWIDLQPRTHTTRAAIVTIALAIPPSGSAALRFNVSRIIGDALGWQPKHKVGVAYSKDGRRLRIMRTTASGYTIGVRGTTLTFGFRLAWLDAVRTAVPAERTPHHVEATALIIDLPAWAVMPTSITKPISPAEAIAEAKREALDLIAAGRSVRDVAAIVGETTETVRQWMVEGGAATRRAA